MPHKTTPRGQLWFHCFKDPTLSGINECHLKKYECAKAAFCQDTHLAYNCICKPGYKGNGDDCYRKCHWEFFAWVIQNINLRL